MKKWICDPRRGRKATLQTVEKACHCEPVHRLAWQSVSKAPDFCVFFADFLQRDYGFPRRFAPRNDAVVREGDEETVGGETAQRILIVDDAPLNRAILREMLGGEFQTAEAADGGNGLYYYALPVEPGQSTTVLCDPMRMGTSVSPTGAAVYQQITVLAEAVQALPEKAAQEAWGVTVENGRITAVK